MGVRSLFFRVIKKEYLKHISFGLIIVNFIFQRIFRINADMEFLVHYTSRVNGAKNLIFECDKIKTSLAISGGCYFSCHSAKIIIGKGTIFAPNISIVSANHDPFDHNRYEAKEVKIGENCWLGSGVVILPGVELGSNVVVGANAVVTKSFGNNLIIAGNPAKVIKTL